MRLVNSNEIKSALSVQQTIDSIGQGFVASRSHCVEPGESHFAVAGGHITEEPLVDIISGNERGRSTSEDIAVADLTAVAGQDIQIAKAVWAAID